jgi:hypothetical protein
VTQEKARPNSSFRGQRKPSYETDDSIDPETAPEVEAGTHDLDFCEGGKDDGEAIIFPSKSLRAERQSGITKAVDLATGFLIAFNTWALDSISHLGWRLGDGGIWGRRGRFVMMLIRLSNTFQYFKQQSLHCADISGG